MHRDDRIDPEVSESLATFLREAVDERQMVVNGSVCADCGGRVFSLIFDDVDGVAARECSTCKSEAFIADSEEFWEEADPGVAVCFTCDGEHFEIATAFTLGVDGSVRWITVALRCRDDNTLDVFVDWSIDYLPTDHLFAAV